MFRTRIIWIALLLCLAVTPSNTIPAIEQSTSLDAATTAPNGWLTHLGTTLWKDFHDVAVVGNRAVATMANGLMILDISDPAFATEVSQVYMDTINLGNIELAGSYAYVASGSHGLVVFDISDIENPILVGALATAKPASDVALTGNIACVLSADPVDGRLYVMDVSTPSTPVLLDSLGGLGRQAVYATPGFAYIVGAPLGSGRLDIVDLAIPTSVTLVANYSTGGSVGYDMAMVDSFVYLATIAPGLQIINVANPALPESTNTFVTSGAVSDVKINNNHAYFFEQNQGFRVLDISSPDQPSLAGWLDTATIALMDVHIAGDFAYLTHSDAMMTVDISTPSSPALAGSMDGSGEVRNTAVSGLTAYVADHSSGLRVVDITNPTAPRAISTVSSTSDPMLDVVVSGSYLYALGGSGLDVYDVSTPASPLPVGQYVGSGGIALAVGPSHAYYFSGPTFNVIDISAPALPQLDTSFLFGHVIDIAISGSFAYVTLESSARFIVMDLSVPSAPNDIASLLLGTPVGDIALSGNYAYVTGDSLYVIDVSTPSTPNVAKAYATQTTTDYVAAAGDYVFVAGSSLEALDVTNPLLPVQIALWEGPGGPLMADGNRLHVGGNGLTILHFSSSVACPVSQTGDVNVTGTLTSADIIYLVNYVFKSQLPPLPCEAAGDVNCSGAITSADVIYMVNHVFKGGQAPCDACTLIPGTWSCP